MKLAKVALIGAVVALVAVLSAPPAQAGVSFSFFYSHLSSHGAWQVSADYGRVWQPYAYHAGWNPYYDGHWVYSDLGWAWASDYEWGAIPYHYGTWVLDPYYGWVWVPGYTWAPSWVVFRTGPDYIGWAPVSPGFSVGVSFGSYAPAPSSFVFVSAHNFLAPRIRSCYVPQSRTTVIVNNTRIVNNLVVENNVVVNRGPDRRFVERASGRSVREVPIERVSRAMPGTRVSRSELRVDPQQAKRGLRAAEPVSAGRALPDGSGTADAPRAGRRLTGDKAERQRDLAGDSRVGRHQASEMERQRDIPSDAPRANRRTASDFERQRDVPKDEPRVDRRLTRDIERQRDAQPSRADRRLTTDFERQRDIRSDAPRANRRLPGDIERRAPAARGDNPRGQWQVPYEKRMKQPESSQRVYREQPGAQNRIQRPSGSDIMRPGRVSPRENGSVRQPNESPNRRPNSGRQGVNREEEPSRGGPSGKTKGGKAHGSGKE